MHRNIHAASNPVRVLQRKRSYIIPLTGARENIYNHDIINSIGYCPGELGKIYCKRNKIQKWEWNVTILRMSKRFKFLILQ